MRLVRPAVAVVVGVSLVFAGAAVAAPKKKPLPCNMITDPKGDAELESGVGNDSALDITSIDLASDTKTLRACRSTTRSVS